MSYAPDYTPTNSFADDETNQASGRSTVKTEELDAQFADISTSFNDLNSNVKKIQRDDDKLRDFIVEPYALSEQTRSMLVSAGKNIRGTWAAFVNYAVGDLVQRNAVAYVCQTAHNSGPAFNVGFWIAISGDGQAQAYAEQAQLSAIAAAASEAISSSASASAVAAAAAALASQIAAAASALAAQNSADSIAGLAPVNLSAYMLGFLGNNAASGARTTLGVSATTDVVLKADLASIASPLVGAGMGGFDWALLYAANSVGWGGRTASTSYNFLRSIPVSEWAAIKAGSSTYDITALLTAAIANERDVFVPEGVWVVDPTIGVRLVASMKLRGAGQNRTIFAAKTGGGTLAQLTNHLTGSVFKRAYTVGVANPRLDTVHLSDFAVVMNHTTASVTTTAIQIGIDLRHVGRTNLQRIWVGNIAPLGGGMVKADPAAYAAQGYGIVIGNVDTGNVGYCGGEVHRIRDCSLFGAYKTSVQDDLVLSPLSGAHGVIIEGCDIQGAHHLLVQEQQYTAGTMWVGNTVQDVRRRPGDATPTYVMRIAGVDTYATVPGYIEAGIADYLVRFDSASDNNRVELGHYGATTIGIAAFSDAGLRNVVRCRLDTGAYPGGVDSKGAPIIRFNRSYLEMGITGHYNGSTIVIDSGFGLTPTRPTGAGDYLFTYASPVLDQHAISVSVIADTNASGHGGLVAEISRSTTNIRIQFYAQNGATTTAIDPRFFRINIKQTGSV